MDRLKRRLICGALVTLFLLTGLFSSALVPHAEARVLAAISQEPDLAITSLKTSPETPSIGDTVTFTITIQNLGDGPAAACLLACFIDEQNFATSQVDAIPAGAASTIIFTWKAKAGPHVFRAVIDSEGGVIESAKTLAFSVLAPDLVVNTISWQPVNPAMGSAVTFTVTITNQGDKKAGSSQLDFCIDGASRGYRTVLPLEPGSSTNETYTWAALSGQHLISATADVLHQVIQSDRTNDHKEVTLSTALPDLIVGSLSIAPQNIMAGDNVTITAVVKNQGTGRAVPSVVAFYIGDTLRDSTYTGFLGPGETSTVTFKWTPDENPLIIKVKADATDILQESDKTNNIATLPSPVVLPDLVIQNITWSPASPVVNSPVIFTITVKNQGNTKSELTDLKYGIDTIYQFTALISELAPGETATTIFMWTPLYPSFKVKAAVNTTNYIKESKESNNTFSKTVSCTNSPTADLSVQDLTISPAKPVIGDTFTLTLSVKNQGTGTVVASYAAIYLDDRQIDPAFIDGLSAGAIIKKDIPISLQGLDYKDSYKIRVELDCNNNVVETNKFNNTKEISFSVLAPDLTIQSIRWTPELPASGERVTFDITVKNRGDAKVDSTYISYYIDNVFTGKHLIEAMEPGANVTRQVIWTAREIPFTLTTIVDEANEIMEVAKSNNSKPVTLPAPDLLIDSVTWSPEKPAEIQPVTFTVNVRNLGAGQAGTTLLYCYVDNATPLTLKTGEIAPGSITNICFTNAFMAGEHAIRFMANGNDAITESDASNNEKTIQFTVQSLPTAKPPPATTSAAIVPATPAKATEQNTQNATPEPVDNIAANVSASPPKWQAILLNKWLLVGVAAVGISAIGMLMLVRKKGKKK